MYNLGTILIIANEYFFRYFFLPTSRGGQVEKVIKNVSMHEKKEITNLTKHF